RANAARLFQEPDAHFESKIFRSQSADGTDVDRVQSVIVVERFARIGGKSVVAPAIDKPERVIADNVFAETNAARAKDATFIIQNYARTEVDPLGLVHLWFDEPAVGLAVIDRVFLQF